MGALWLISVFAGTEKIEIGEPAMIIRHPLLSQYRSFSNRTYAQPICTCLACDFSIFCCPELLNKVWCHNHWLDCVGVRDPNWGMYSSCMKINCPSPLFLWRCTSLYPWATEHILVDDVDYVSLWLLILRFGRIDLIQQGVSARDCLSTNYQNLWSWNDYPHSLLN